MHYEYAFLLHARPCVSTRGQVHHMCGLPQIIMNYELIQTRTSVRLYERAGQPNVWITPNNYEYEYAFLLHARPCVSTRGQVRQMCGLPQIIMNYELIQTRTSARFYERTGSPDVWITPNNYELCIMNYALIHRLYSMYVFTSSATHFA